MKKKPKQPPASELIKCARAASGLTQEAAAAVTGYSVSAIRKFEQGRVTPPQRGMSHILATLAAVKP